MSKLMPKQGTLERVVLEMAIASKEAGFTFLDFPPELGLTEEKLDQVVNNLRHGLFDAENDDELKFDA